MSKVLTVIRKEYLERVKSKAFLIGTLIGPIFMAGLVLGPTLLADVAGDQQRDVVVVDHTGVVMERLEAELAELEITHVTLQELTCDGDAEACLERLRTMVRGEEVDAGLVIPPDFFDTPRLAFYNRSVSAIVMRGETLGPALDRILREERFRRHDLDPALHTELLAETTWDDKVLTEESEAEQHAEVGIIGGIMIAMIIYFMMLVYGQQNLTVVIEEKGSRMVEVLLASLRPEQLMLGKVMGIGLAAFTQVAVWTLAGVFTASQGPTIGDMQINLSHFGVWFWFNFLLFFSLGYFVYASLYAGIGAMCNSIQDAQQFSGVLTMGVVLPILLMMVVIKAPDAPFTMVLSLIPFFSPILMFLRISMSNPPLWQVVLSWVLLVLTIWWSNKAAGKLFRAGILLYGTTPTWGSLGKAMKG